MIRKILRDYRVWIAFFGIVAIIITKTMGFAELPEKVKKAETKIEETEDNLDKLAEQVGQYIAVQAAKEEKETENKQLLLKLIEKIVEK